MQIEPMSIIYKYQLEIVDRQEKAMPVGAEILGVQNQRGTLTLWAWVNPKAKVEIVPFYVFGTGHPIDQTGIEEYVGTVQIDDLVWHVFKGRAAKS